MARARPQLSRDPLDGIGPRYMEHFRTYLRAELGKLRNSGDAQQFCCHVPDEWRAATDLPATIPEINARFQSQDAVDTYVASLSDDCLVQLTGRCGEWRNNGISDLLSPQQHYEFILAPVARVLLSPAEGCLVGAFGRNGWQLSAIAVDPEVLSVSPYRHHQPGEHVRFPICLARPVGDLYCIFDGIHRAIQLVRNGEDCVRLCVVRA